jgi:hypothetical protein
VDKTDTDQLSITFAALPIRRVAPSWRGWLLGSDGEGLSEPFAMSGPAISKTCGAGAARLIARGRDAQ